MTRWIKHDGSAACPLEDGDVVVEVEQASPEVTIFVTLPAAAVVGWEFVTRYRDTGERSAWRPSPPETEPRRVRRRPRDR